jgi:hypothetical protein
MKLFPVVHCPEFAVFKKLTTPQKIQDFIGAKLRMNFEQGGDTYRSPRAVLQAGEAHCAEGAMLAAAVLWYHGKPPLLLDLKVVKHKGDVDHVVALFKEGGCWGAISKTNHAVLRYRDPVYKTVRELALSYFNEYFLKSGEKTLRSYSIPFDISRYGSEWLTASEDLDHIMEALDESRHFDIVDKNMPCRLRRADPIEITASHIAEWPDVTTF